MIIIWTTDFAVSQYTASYAMVKIIPHRTDGSKEVCTHFKQSGSLMKPQFWFGSEEHRLEPSWFYAELRTETHHRRIFYASDGSMQNWEKVWFFLALRRTTDSIALNHLRLWLFCVEPGRTTGSSWYRLLYGTISSDLVLTWLQQNLLVLRGTIGNQNFLDFLQGDQSRDYINKIVPDNRKDLAVQSLISNVSIVQRQFIQMFGPYCTLVKLDVEYFFPCSNKLSCVDNRQQSVSVPLL